MADEDLLGLFWPAATTPAKDPFASLAASPSPSPPAPAAPGVESFPPAAAAASLIGKDTSGSGSAGRIGNDKKSERRSTSDLAKAKKHRSRQSMPAAKEKRKSSTDAYYEKRKSASGADAPSKSSNGRLSALDAKKGGTGRSPPTSRSNNNRSSNSRYKPVSKTSSRGTRTSTSSSAGAAAQSSSSRNKGGEKMRGTREKLYQGSRSSTARQSEDNKPQGSSGTRISTRNASSSEQLQGSAKRATSSRADQRTSNFGGAAPWATTQNNKQTTTTATKDQTRDNTNGVQQSSSSEWDIDGNVGMSVSDDDDIEIFAKEDSCSSSDSEDDSEFNKWEDKESKSKDSELQTTTTTTRRHTKSRKSTSSLLRKTTAGRSSDQIASSKSNHALRRNTTTNTRMSSYSDLSKMAKEKIAEHERHQQHQKQERRGSKSALLGPSTSKNKLESKLSTPDLSMLRNRMTVATKKGSATSPPVGFRRRRRTVEVMVDIVNDSKDDNGMQNSNHSLLLAEYYRGRHSRHDIDKTKSFRSSSLDSARRLPRRNSDINYAQYYEQIKETEELKRPVILSRQDSTSGRNPNKGMVKSNISRRLLSTRATSSSSSLKPLARRNSTEDRKKLKKRQARNNDVRRLSNSWTERSFRGSTTSSRLSASLQPNNFSLQGEEYEVGSDTDRDVSTLAKSKRSSESLNRVLDRLGSMEDKVYSTSITSSKIGDSGGDDENNDNNIEKSKVQKEKDEDGYADDNGDDDVLQMFDGMRKNATQSTDASDKSKRKKKEQDSLEESQSSSSNTKEKKGSLQEKKKKPESSSSKSRGSGLFKRFSMKSLTECTAEASTSTSEDEDSPDGENETIKSKDSSKGSSKKSRASTVKSKTSNATDDENETIKSKDSSKGSSKKSRASTVNSKTSTKSKASTVNSKRSQRPKKTPQQSDEDQGDDEEDKSKNKNKKKRWWKKGSSSEVPDTSAATSGDPQPMMKPKDHLGVSKVRRAGAPRRRITIDDPSFDEHIRRVHFSNSPIDIQINLFAKEKKGRMMAALAKPDPLEYSDARNNSKHPAGQYHPCSHRTSTSASPQTQSKSPISFDKRGLSRLPDLPFCPKIGDIASPQDMIIEMDKSKALQSVKALKVHDVAWLRRSNGIWTWAIIANFPAVSGKHATIRFVVDKNGSTKTVKAYQWVNCIRLAKKVTSCSQSWSDNSNSTQHSAVEKDELSAQLRKEEWINHLRNEMKRKKDKSNCRHS